MIAVRPMGLDPGVDFVDENGGGAGVRFSEETTEKRVVVVSGSVGAPNHKDSHGTLAIANCVSI